MPFVAFRTHLEDLPLLDMMDIKASGVLVSDKVPTAIESNGRRIELQPTTPHYGGVRYWLVCTCCSSNRRALYFYENRWQCRKCTGLQYRSQAYDKKSQAQWQAEKQEAKLNTDGSKPKWMRWATYDRLCDEIAYYQNQYSEHAMKGLYARFASASPTGRSLGAIIKRSIM